MTLNTNAQKLQWLHAEVKRLEAELLTAGEQNATLRREVKQLRRFMQHLLKARHGPVRRGKAGHGNSSRK